jgi:Dual specificity phosphatase, catalytic domain
MLTDLLDHHLISDSPSPLFMGALPERWETIPARIVVNLCGLFPEGSARRRIVHALPMLDIADEGAMPTRDRLEAFVDVVHGYAAHEPTYWHCHAGLNRSGLCVAMYLHRHRGLRISEAIRTMRRRRSMLVLCNPTFERKLREWYGDEDEQVSPTPAELAALEEPYPGAY